MNRTQACSAWLTMTFAMSPLTWACVVQGKPAQPFQREPQRHRPITQVERISNATISLSRVLVAMPVGTFDHCVCDRYRRRTRLSSKRFVPRPISDSLPPVSRDKMQRCRFRASSFDLCDWCIEAGGLHMVCNPWYNLLRVFGRCNHPCPSFVQPTFWPF